MLRWLAVPAFFAGLAFIGAAEAADERGGPVRTMLIVAEKPIPVDVTWLQSGGVVMLKVISASPIEADQRDKTVEEAQKLVDKFVGARTTVAASGQLILWFRMVGWKKPFTANDLAIGAKPAAAPAPPPTGVN